MGVSVGDSGDRRPFVPDGHDTSGFTFIREIPSHPGAPRLSIDGERARLDTLTKLLQISDTDDPVVMSMCKLVRSLLRVPVAGISILDEDRCWFKTPEGTSVFPRNLNLCAYHLIVEDPTVIVVEDMTADPRSKHFPFVVDDPKLRFYASAPLIASDGARIGTMCVVDLKPRTLTHEQYYMLANFAECMVRQLEKDNHVVLEKKTKKALCRTLDTVLSPIILLDTTDANWVIKHVNEPFAELAGFDRDTLLEKNFWDYFSVVGKPKEAAKEESQRQVRGEADFDMQLKCGKGDPFTLHLKPSNGGLVDEHALPIVKPRTAPRARDQTLEVAPPPIYFGSVQQAAATNVRTTANADVPHAPERDTVAAEGKAVIMANGHEEDAPLANGHGKHAIVANGLVKSATVANGQRDDAQLSNGEGDGSGLTNGYGKEAHAAASVVVKSPQKGAKAADSAKAGCQCVIC